MYKLQSLSPPYASYWLHESRYLLGEHPEAQIVIKGQGELSLLACLLREGDGYAIKDLNSATGVLVNEHRVTHKSLQLGDEIRVADQHFVLNEPKAAATDHFANQWQLFLETGTLKQSHFPLSAETTHILGRSSDCSLIINNPHIAKKQLRFTQTEDGLQVTNLSSRQPLFVNNLHVESALLHNGDRLRLDIFRFFVVAPFTNHSPQMQNSPKPETASTPAPAINKPRRWKTKPTSPGNRYEYPLEKSPSYQKLGLVVLILILACCAGLLLW